MNNEIFCLDFESAKYRLVLMHGWGADAQDLIPLAQKIINTDKFALDIVSLRAPQLHPEGFGRMWYPLFPHDWDAVPFAVSELETRIKKISINRIPLIPLSKTILLGFSQGGAMALEMGSILSVKGVIACSSYPHPEWTPSNQNSPVFMTHGKHDDIVPFSASERAINLLKKYKIESNMFVFSGGHEIPDELVNKFQLVINNWLIE